MDYLDAEWLIGHKVKITTGTYIKPDIHRLKHDYGKILPYLSLSEVKPVNIKSPEFKEIVEKYEIESKAKDEKIKRQEEEIKKLKAEKDEEINLLREENERNRKENEITRKLVEDLMKHIPIE